MNKSVSERVKALQSLMEQKGIDTYIVLSSDAHQSEYVGRYWMARAWISGFTGSANLLPDCTYISTPRGTQGFDTVWPDVFGHRLPSFTVKERCTVAPVRLDYIT